MSDDLTDFREELKRYGNLNRITEQGDSIITKCIVFGADECLAHLVAQASVDVNVTEPAT
jgi:hypothetical protein